MHQPVGLVAHVHQLAELAVLLGMHLGFLDHLVDLLVGQPAGGLDHDLLLASGGLVLRRNVQDAVGVDVEGHLDLRHAARRRRDVGEVEAAQRLVVRGPLAFALQHVDRHRGLSVLGGREHLVGAGRNGRVLVDQTGHDLAERLDAQRQRGHVEEQHVLDAARKHAGLDGGAQRHGLVGIHVLARIAPEEVAHGVLDLGHADLAAHQDHVADVAHGKAGIGQRGAAGLDRAGDQVLHQGLELGAGDPDVQVLGAVRVGGDERQVDFRLLLRGQFDLGFLRGFLEALHGQRVLADVHALFLLELAGEVVDQPVVEVLAAQEGVAVGGQHFELRFAVDLGNLDDRDVEGAAAEVVDGDLAVAALLAHAVGQGGRGRLVDDALDLQPRDPAGVLGGLALRVVEVGRDRNHGFGHVLAQEVLGGLPHLLQHPRGNLGRSDLAPLDLHPGVAVVRFHQLVRHHPGIALHDAVLEPAPDQTLDRVQRVGGIGDGLALGGLAHQDLIILGKGDDRRRCPVALGILDDFALLAVHDGHAGIGGSQVDSDDFAHACFSMNLNIFVTSTRYEDSGPAIQRHGVQAAEAR